MGQMVLERELSVEEQRRIYLSDWCPKWVLKAKKHTDWVYYDNRGQLRAIIRFICSLYTKTGYHRYYITFISSFDDLEDKPETTVLEGELNIRLYLDEIYDVYYAVDF
jgi:hypothetical protein